MSPRANVVTLMLCAVAFFSMIATSSAMDTSWRASEDTHASNDYTARAHVVAQSTKTRCGSTIRVRVFKRGSWGRGWRVLACGRSPRRGLKLSQPTVTVDKTNNKIFVVWFQSAFFRTRLSSVVYRVSSNDGRSWSKTRRLVGVPNRLPTSVSASADQGILWVAWQRASSIKDTNPSIRLSAFTQTGKRLSRNILRGRSDRRDGLRVFAGNGIATVFWKLTDVGNRSRWYSARTGRITGARSARRARVAKYHRPPAVGRLIAMRRGEDGRIYNMVQWTCARCDATFVGIVRWNGGRGRFDLLNSVAIGFSPFKGHGIAIGISASGERYLAYVDPDFAEAEVQEDCSVLIQGARWCARSLAPEPSPPFIYVRKFGKTGELLDTTNIRLPFAMRAQPGSTVVEFAYSGRGASGISSHMAAQRLTFIAGHEAVDSGADPGKGASLTGVVTDPLF